MAPSACPDGRPSRGVWETGSDTGRAAHFRAVCAQRGALTPDVQPWRRHMIGWPIWPAIDLARPCECHGTIIHVTAAIEGVCWHHPQPERLRLALCHLGCRTCASHPICWDMSSSRRELSLEADGGCLVLHGAAQWSLAPIGATRVPTHKPSRRCVASV